MSKQWENKIGKHPMTTFELNNTIKDFGKERGWNERDITVFSNKASVMVMEYFNDLQSNKKDTQNDERIQIAASKIAQDLKWQGAEAIGQDFLDFYREQCKPILDKLQDKLNKNPPSETSTFTPEFRK